MMLSRGVKAPPPFNIDADPFDGVLFFITDDGQPFISIYIDGMSKAEQESIESGKV